MLCAENNQSKAPFLEQPSQNVCDLTLVLGGITVFAPVIDGGTTHLPVTVIRLSLLVAFMVWLTRAVKAGSLVLYRVAFLPLVVAFIGLAGISLIWSPYFNPGFHWFVSLCTYAIFFSLLLNGVESITQARVLMALILGMGLFEGAFGIVQYLWLGEARAKGTFFNPNFFATYEVVALMLSLGLLSYQSTNKRDWKKMFFLVCTTATTFLAFVMAQSRGAALAFLIAAMSVGFYRFGKMTIVFLLVLVLGGFVVPNPIKQRLFDVSAHDPYAYTRFEIWDNSLHRIADHPVGIGLGMYKYLSFLYRFPSEHTIVRYGKRAESAHNEYLQIAVELGVGGLVLFLLGIGVWARSTIEVLKERLPSREKGAIVGLSGGVLAILVHAAMDSVFHEPALVLLLILCGTLVIVLKRLHAPDYVPTWKIPFPYHPARVALVGFLGVVSTFLIIQPAAGWFAYEQGNIASQMSQNDLAWEWYHRATLIDPGTAAYHDAVAQMDVARFYASGNSEWLIRALEEVTICRELNPLDGRPPSRLGILYLLLAERVTSDEQRGIFVARAEESYEEAIKVDPFSPFNYLELGKLRWRRGQPDEAQTLMAKAIAYEPNFLPARVLLAELASQSGKADIARSQYAAIEEVRERYKGQSISPLERRYLDVDANLNFAVHDRKG